MPRYEIEQNELCTVKYQVDAADEAEAIAKLFESADCPPIEGSLERQGADIDRGLLVDEHPALVQQLRERGIDHLDDVIPGIAGVTLLNPPATHTYEIEQYELHSVRLRVRAGNQAEAIQFVLQGKGQTIEESQEFIEVADRYGLPVSEHAELGAELRALGVKCLTDVIPSIRDIEMVDVDDDVSSVEGISPTLAADAAVRLFRIDGAPIAGSPTRSQLVRARSPGEAAEIAMELWTETCSTPPDGSVFVVSPLDEPEGVVGVVLEPAGRETRWQVQDGQAQPALQTYRVRYEIDVDAEEPLAAARQAYVYMLSPDSYRPVLEVAPHRATGEVDFSTAETFDLHEWDYSDRREDMVRQLELVADIIESTYPHDADGRRMDGDSPVSGADVVERLAELEQPIREVLQRHASRDLI